MIKLFIVIFIVTNICFIILGFEDLMRAYQKALPVIAKEELGQTPRFYIRCLVEMEDFINEVWEDRDGRKNMSKNNSKSLSTLRQKLRKYNKDFEEDIGKFRENPDQDDDEEEEKGLITIGNIYNKCLSLNLSEIKELFLFQQRKL